MRVFTIGYEGATQAELVATLLGSGVTRLVDVRELPLSRRPGFSKTALRLGLADAGIDYLHLRALGTPPAGREAARRGRHAEMAAIYRTRLADPDALAAAAQLRDMVARTPCALLCFEREPAHCHRQVLIDEMLADATVVHLFPGAHLFPG